MNDLQTLPAADACPWCGIGGSIICIGRSGPYYDWQCGSWKRGEVPWQSNVCRINEAEATIGQLRSKLADALARTKRFLTEIINLA